MALEFLEHLQYLIDRAPPFPGVYLMKDANGAVIYVGKAIHLKKRLLSYIQRYPHPEPKTRVLVTKIRDIETIITGTENEALILESTLIKRYRPRYNVILKDDKRYPSLRLDVREPFPRLALVRRIEEDGALYFGPFSSPGALHETVHLLHRIFPLRKCRDTVFHSRKRPCLQYQIGRCLGPCCLPVDERVYRRLVDEVVLFLRGEGRALMGTIESDMQDAARRQDFEAAIMLRDRLAAIRKVVERQVVVTAEGVDRDVIALVEEGDQSVITVMKVRKGALVEHRHFHFSEAAGSIPVMLGNFLAQYYERNTGGMPDEILVSEKPESATILQQHLRSIGNASIVLRKANDPLQKQLMLLARQNALNELGARIHRKEYRIGILNRIQEKFGMKTVPQRIACIDNSHWQGEEAVSSVVVFYQGEPCPAEYRRYRLRATRPSDDYAAMTEVLKRRFIRPSARLPLPDMLLIDGGKGQLHAAQTVLSELGLGESISLAAIAKGDDRTAEDRIFLPHRPQPLDFSRDKDILLLFQRIRDEAHRTAVSFHRRRKRSAALHSLLDTIPGIGPKRKKEVLTRFTDIESIRNVPVDEIAALPGMCKHAAEKLKAAVEDSLKSAL